MIDVNEKIKFYSLGSEKIDFTKIQNFLNLDTSKPVVASKGFNKALKSVIDKDIDFLTISLKKLINKINVLLDSNCLELGFELEENLENISSTNENLKGYISKLVESKKKNKISIFSSDKKRKKENLKRLEDCIYTLNNYQNELISIGNEYNKLIERKNKLGFVENEIEENKNDYEDPLERTINFYMNQKQKN